MNKRMNKRTRSNIIACVLIIIFSLINGTILAWFYNSTVIEASGGFKMAEVNGEANLTGVQTFKMEPATWRNPEHRHFILQWRIFERYLKTFSGNDEEKMNKAFREFWDWNGGQAEQWFIEKSNTKPSEITPGDLIIKTYQFTNNSDIPIYLRMASPVNLSGIPVTYFMDFDGKDVHEAHSYWYWADPLDQNETVEVKMLIYIPVGLNTSITIPYGDIKVRLESADIIQATNNAVYWCDGWKDLAEAGFFK